MILVFFFFFSTPKRESYKLVYRATTTRATIRRRDSSARGHTALTYLPCVDLFVCKHEWNAFDKYTSTSTVPYVINVSLLSIAFDCKIILEIVKWLSLVLSWFFLRACDIKFQYSPLI